MSKSANRRAMANARCCPAAGAHSKIALAVAAALCGATAARGPTALAADAAAPNADATSAQSANTLQEVVVTATKRTENLQNVPLSVDVFTAQDLQNLDIKQFEDYAYKTPSVTFTSVGPGTQSFFIRGVSDGANYNNQNTSTTGFFVDDMSLSWYGSIPDFHEYDIERIEVLNGPQGTLFGAGSMAGAVRIITNKPDPTAFSAGIDLGAGSIHDGRYNSTYEGFVNVPIIQGSTALRLSAYAVHDGGFIDNLQTTRNWVNGAVSTNAEWAGIDFNTQNMYGGRAAIKQVFSEGWSATLSYNYQRQSLVGAWDQDPTRYALRQVSRFGPQNANNYIKTLDLHVDGDVGIGDLVYAGTYWSLPFHRVDEYSEYVQYSPDSIFSAANLQSFACLTGPTIANSYQGLPQSPFSGCGVPTMYTIYDTATDRWSHELRLQSKSGGRFHWLVGAYWEKTRQIYSDFYAMPNIQPNGEAYQSQLSYYYYANEPAASPLPQEWYSYKSRIDYRQIAEFTDETFDIFDWWSLEGGLQHFQSNFTTSSEWAGYFWSPKLPSSYSGGSHKVNFKASSNFKLAKNLLLYVTFSQGFRDGGVNGGLAEKCYQNGAQNYYKPDTLNNFEVGFKSLWLDGRLLWNLAAYYMPWKDYQVPVFNLDICPTTFNANIGDARIYGAESNVEYRITDALTLQVSGSYNDPKLVSNTFYSPNYVVYPGERLPYVAYFNWSGNLRYERPLSGELKAYFQYDVAHKGDMWSDLRAVDPHGFARTLQPEYTISDLRFGLNGSRWQTELYVTNLWDTNAVIYSNTFNYDHRQTTNEPRVVGLRVSYRWGK